MSTDRNWTLPNLLTVMRILLTPMFVMAFSNDRFDLAWVLFAIAGFTDAMDGFLARVLKQRSRLGSILDPLADKILLVTSYICLTLQGWIPKWLTVMIVSRDLIIVGGLAFLQFWGTDVRRSIKPTWLGKSTTMMQILLVLFVMIQESLDLHYPNILTGAVFLTGTLTLLSGIDYMREGFSLFPDDENIPD